MKFAVAGLASVAITVCAFLGLSFHTGQVLKHMRSYRELKILDESLRQAYTIRYAESDFDGVDPRMTSFLLSMRLDRGSSSADLTTEQVSLMRDLWERHEAAMHALRLEDTEKASESGWPVSDEKVTRDKATIFGEFSKDGSVSPYQVEAINTWMASFIPAILEEHSIVERQKRNFFMFNLSVTALVGVVLLVLSVVFLLVNALSRRSGERDVGLLLGGQVKCDEIRK